MAGVNDTRVLSLQMLGLMLLSPRVSVVSIISLFFPPSPPPQWKYHCSLFVIPHRDTLSQKIKIHIRINENKFLQVFTRNYIVNKYIANSFRQFIYLFFFSKDILSENFAVLQFLSRARKRGTSL